MDRAPRRAGTMVHSAANVGNTSETSGQQLPRDRPKESGRATAPVDSQHGPHPTGERAAQGSVDSMLRRAGADFFL